MSCPNYEYFGLSMQYTTGKKVAPMYGRSGPAAACRVTGALRMVFHVSRVVGAAPVHMSSRKGLWQLQYHSGGSVYSHVVVVMLVTMSITALVLDVRLDEARSVRAKDMVKSLVWVLDVGIVVAMLIASLFTGPERTRQLVKVLNELEKIDAELKNKKKTHSNRRLLKLTTVTLLLTLPLYAIDIVKHVWKAYHENREWRIAFGSIPFYIMYLIRTLITAQFILAASAVNFTLRAVNDELEEHLSETCAASNFIYIRRLARYHGTLCDLVLELNRSHSAMLITLVVGFVLYLVITPYFLLDSLSPNYVFEYPHMVPLLLLLQLMWCMYHSLFMIAVIEPCHMTTEEVRRTKKLLSQLMRRVSSSSEPLLEQVSLFISQLSSSSVEYSPYGFCVLHRPLIATIIGVVTTYLVIILQFQGLKA